MHCVGGDAATAQTEPVRGPDGTTAVLKVSSADDASKNSHQCMADYVLLVTRSGSAPTAVDLLSSDGDWDRALSLQLVGFTQDGQRVLAKISESGRYPSAMLFDYELADGKVELIDLKKRFARIVAATCKASYGVVGTTETGEIVIEVGSSQPCKAAGRWVLSRAGGGVSRVPQGASVQGLYVGGGTGTNDTGAGGSRYEKISDIGIPAGRASFPAERERGSLPSRYVIDAGRRLVVSTGWDRVTSAEILAHRERLKNDPDFKPEFDQLVDGRAVTELDVSMEEARTIASRTLFSSASRRAFVASDLAILGMARLMEMHSTSDKRREQVRVFHDLRSALQWLGLESLP